MNNLNHSKEMDKEIDNILYGYYLKQYDLITVKQKILILFGVSQRSDLLLFIKWQKLNFKDIYLMSDDLVAKTYLETL